MISKEVLVLIPAYNEGESIKNTIEDLKDTFENILVVNDGSVDNTLKIISSLNIDIINHSINCGQGMALETGFKYFIRNSKFKYIITFDADGQHNKNDALKMMNHIKENNYSAVIGSRFIKKDTIKMIPKAKRIILRLASIYERIFHLIKFKDAHNGLRVIKREVVENYLLPIKNYDMNHATEISKKLSDKRLMVVEFPVSINYYNKKSQSIWNAINILIKLIFFN